MESKLYNHKLKVIVRSRKDAEAVSRFKGYKNGFYNGVPLYYIEKTTKFNCNHHGNIESEYPGEKFVLFEESEAMKATKVSLGKAMMINREVIKEED